MPRNLPSLAAALALALAAAAPALPQDPPSAIAAMNQPSAETERLVARTGTWDASVTIWPAPGADPIPFPDLVARRTMVGTFMQEVLTPDVAGSPAWQRLAYLTWNRVEGRWQYVSMDTRFPAGIMPASSVDAGTPDRIELQFEPIAFPGWGKDVDGWMLRSSYEVEGIGTDHETARQYWTRADGTATRWLGVEYRYDRRP
jgi:hypothetical protein